MIETIGNALFIAAMLGIAVLCFFIDGVPWSRAKRRTTPPAPPAAPPPPRSRAATPEETRLLLVGHFAKLGREGTVACPYCGCIDYSVSSPVNAPLFGLVGTRYEPMSEAVPLIPAICKRCYRVDLFAWVPIAQPPEAPPA